MKAHINPSESRLAKISFPLRFYSDSSKSLKGGEGGVPYLNIGRNLIYQRHQCMKQKSRFWSRVAWQKSLVFHRFHPNSGSWHLVIGKLNYNIRLDVITVDYVLLKTQLAPEFTSSPLPWLRRAL